MDNAIKEIFKALINRPYDITSEADTQRQINTNLINHINGNILKPKLREWLIWKEYALDKKSRLDFLIEPFGIAIEVKVKGNPTQTLKQCERYCQHDKVKSLILATAKFTGFPKEINGKPIYLLHLSKGML